MTRLARRTVLAALCLILAVLFAGGCEDADDGVTPSDCGELSAPCEGH